jgi:uncharacterized membrane protein YqjE
VSNAQGRDGAPGGGLLDSLRKLAHTLIGLIETRLALFANELEDHGARLARIALLWALAAYCLALAIILGSVLLAVIFWDTHRIPVLAAITAVFGIAGIAAALAGRSIAASRPRALSATLAELARDRQALERATVNPAAANEPR